MLLAHELDEYISASRCDRLPYLNQFHTCISINWRCHRSVIADALIVRGIDVCEITSGVRAKPHVLMPWARVEGTHILYAA
jgi:uncharacterized protein (DUF488 family)